ncbi:MAG: alanine racemase [Pseudomonadota bacterium]
MTVICTEADSQLRSGTHARAWATIDLQALRANLSLVRTTNPNCSLVVVVKANAYGHGLVPVAEALRTQLSGRDCFGVATLDEALALRRAGITEPVLLLEGFVTAAELEIIVQHEFQFVVHALYQLEILQTYFSGTKDFAPLSLWLKVDTGMHRLGLNETDFAAVWQSLHGSSHIDRLVVMSHFACADDPQSPVTERQIASLQQALAYAGVAEGDCDLSLAASAAILIWPQTHFQWLRPGIMLYGGSAIAGENGVDRGLLPVMTLRSRIISIKTVAAGEVIGYGATYVCEREHRLAVVSIGYGDGYPRSAPNGTPVLIHSRSAQGPVRKMAALAGRVSMDKIIVDLSGCEEAAVGDEVILWGEGLPADEIARRCGTIAYELFCQVTARVHYVYSDERGAFSWPR